MALWGKVDSKVVPGTVAVTQYDPSANSGAGNATAAKTVTGTGTAFATTTVTAGSFVSGQTYTILTVGTTDFTAIGAASNGVGVTFTATGAGTGTGTATTGLKNGQTLLIGSPAVPYKIGNIVSATSLMLTTPYLGATASGLTVTSNESPVFASQGQYPSAPYGVNQAEMVAGGDQILAVTLIDGGSGYVEDPVPTVTTEDGVDAVFDVTIADGEVTAIALSDTGSGYAKGDTITIPKARLTIPMAGVTTATDTVAYTGHGLSVADRLVYNDGGGAAATGLVEGTSYYASGAGFTANAFKVAASALAAAGTALTTVAVSGIAGQCTCAAASLAVGDRVVATGTLTGDATGIAANTVYKVSAITGSSPNVTGFTLTTEAGGALTTTAGTTTGLVFKSYAVVDIDGTGNDDQYFEKYASTAATAVLVFGAGTTVVDGATTIRKSPISAPGWVVVKTGTGGRAGRVAYETLAVVKSIKNDASDDAAFPE